MRLLFLLLSSCVVASADRPNVVLVMADDQGWGQTGYYNHPVLKTPHLDAMAKAGLRFDRFYACLLYTSPSPRDLSTSRMPSSA